MNSQLDLTIAIPVRNEEKNLPACLLAIGTDIASEIVVIDSNSTDATVQIARQYGAAVVNFSWDGNFPKKRNWFLRNYPIKTKWILFIDADEYLTADFKRELRSALEQDTKVGYWLNYSIYFMGRKLKGGYPLKKLALFKPGAGEYEKIEENEWSTLDMEVHEHPILSGGIGVIKSKIDHKDFRSTSSYVIKHNEYSSWEARRFLAYVSDVKEGKKWTWKQKIKYKLMSGVLIAPAYFFASFFILGGFRDGARGFVFAMFKMAYFAQVYCKIKELSHTTKGNLPA